jgi:2-(1,2-epoxy-1,2-dihydrophenyl)acetyl-CoA isomerase
MTEMQNEDMLKVVRGAGVVTITLNRPDRGNALTRPLKSALRDALARAAKDDSVRAVVLAGAGRSFCAGQDLAEHAHP